MTQDGAAPARNGEFSEATANGVARPQLAAPVAKENPFAADAKPFDDLATVTVRSITR